MFGISSRNILSILAFIIFAAIFQPIMADSNNEVIAVDKWLEAGAIIVNQPLFTNDFDSNTVLSRKFIDFKSFYISEGDPFTWPIPDGKSRVWSTFDENKLDIEHPENSKYALKYYQAEYP